MKTHNLTLILLLFAISVFAQNAGIDDLRFIEVAGSAEMEVEPDEIRFQIGITEYWKEEFEKGKEYKDYVTKIPLEEIEKNLMSELASIGITKEQMILKDAGTSWTREGKDFRKGKAVEIIITDFNLINEINRKVKTKGLSFMRISELKNKNITEYRKQVKIEAMKAAKEKATYLLQSVGENIGKVISIIELDENKNLYWAPQSALSNTIMQGSGSYEVENEALKQIKLKYEVKVRFEIK